MKKLLIYGDSPYAQSGLGRLSRYMCKMFKDDYQILVIGVNHVAFTVYSKKATTMYKKEDFDCDVLSPQEFNQVHLTNESMGIVLDQFKPDLIITTLDHQHARSVGTSIKQYQSTSDAKWIIYTAIDHAIPSKQLFRELLMSDKTIFYSEYGYKKAIEAMPNASDRFGWIHLPLDNNEFPQINKGELKKFKKSYFNLEDGQFLVGLVGRNIPRKNYAQAFRVLGKLRDQNVKFYFHCEPEPKEAYRTPLSYYMTALDINTNKAIFPNIKEVYGGFMQEGMNKIYRSFDLLLSTSTGEGFGYSQVEALLVKTPVLVPDNSSHPELVGDNGYLIEKSEELDLMPSSFSYWSSINTDDAVEKIKYIIDNYKEAQEKAKNGRKWVLNNLSLDFIKSKWLQVINEISI